MNTNSATPQQPVEDDVPTLITGLELLVENGKYHLFDHVFIDEQAFFISTARLKRALPGYLARAELAAPQRLGGDETSNELGIHLLRLIRPLA